LSTATITGIKRGRHGQRQKWQRIMNEPCFMTKHARAWDDEHRETFHRLIERAEYCLSFRDLENGPILRWEEVFNDISDDVDRIYKELVDGGLMPGEIVAELMARGPRMVKTRKCPCTLSDVHKVLIEGICKEEGVPVPSRRLKFGEDSHV